MTEHDELVALQTALRQLVEEWRADAAFNPRETSPQYAWGREKSAKELARVLDLHRPASGASDDAPMSSSQSTGTLLPALEPTP